MKKKSNLVVFMVITLIFVAGGLLFFRQKDSLSSNITTGVEAQKCIIVVDGNKYDVSTFRDRHEGGNVFVCDSDMSVAFHNQHSNKFLGKIERYKVL